MYVTSLFVFPSTLLSPKILVLFPMDNYSFEISSLFPRTGLCGNRQQQVQQPQHFILYRNYPCRLLIRENLTELSNFISEQNERKAAKWKTGILVSESLQVLFYCILTFFCVFSCTFYYLICDCNKVGSTNSYEPKCLLFLSVIYSILEIFVRPLVLFPDFFFQTIFAGFPSFVGFFFVPFIVTIH